MIFFERKNQNLPEFTPSLKSRRDGPAPHERRVSGEKNYFINSNSLQTNQKKQKP
jgi:hypothetical protein